MAIDKIDLALSNSAFFKNLKDDEKKAVLSECSHETWQKGRSIPSCEMEETLHFVISGHIKSVRINADTGRTLTLFLFETGDIFDIVQLLLGTPGDSVFEAYSDVYLLTAPKTAALRWINTYPSFNQAVLPYLGRMLQHLEDLASGLALHDTETRLAHLILRHISSEIHNDFRLIYDMTDENIAQMIGSVRAVVNRHLQHWRKSGIISSDTGEISVDKLLPLLNKTEKQLQEKKVLNPAPKS